MLHYLASQMRETRVRMRDEELQSSNARRSASRSMNSRSTSQSRSRSRSRGSRHSGGPQSARTPRGGEEFFQFAPPMRLPMNAGVMLASRTPRAGTCEERGTPTRLSESRPRRTITLSPNAHANAQGSNLLDLESNSTQTGDNDENADPQQSSAWVFLSRRNQRTFARPWRFQEIYSDWSLSCIHRLFWLSVACIHIGIFLLFIGGFFHKTPSRLASTLVSLGIFILSCGLAMYTLAKSIIRARARQCERVLQVVLDLVEPPNEIVSSRESQNVDSITGVVDSPPPYEAPPPYPEPQGSSQGTTAADSNGATSNPTAEDTNVTVSGPTTDGCHSSVDEPKTPDEDCVEPSYGTLPPTYSSLNIPDDVNDRPERGELPPAYTEFP